MVKVGRPEGSKSEKMKGTTGCHEIVIYRKVKGVVRKVRGYKRKSCLKKKK